MANNVVKFLRVAAALCAVAAAISFAVLYELLDNWVLTRPYHLDSVHGYTFRIENHGAVFFVTSHEYLLWKMLSYSFPGIILIVIALGVLSVLVERKG